MPSIFFDLETSDTEYIGQIMNYAFIAVDDDFEIIDECCGPIKLSPTQLPTAGAILTNRIHLKSHQTESEDIEIDAMARIHDFISSVCRSSSDKVPLIGYNSNRFDIPFLRTSLIRNGINPYFNGRVIYRDLLHASQKLSVSDKSFPRVENPVNAGRLTLRLEALAKHFKILKGDQLHESRDDVIITINLAKLYLEQFDLDIRSWDAYEVRDITSNDNQGLVIEALRPNYDLSEDSLAVKKQLMLLDSDPRYALWVDLNRFSEEADRSAVSWFNMGAGALLSNGKPIETDETEALSKAAIKKYSKLSLKNFFAKSDCDIEADIYRLDFNEIDALKFAIWNGNRSKLNALKRRDAKVVFTRSKLTRYDVSVGPDPKMDELLKKYAMYRYGGQAKLNKFEDREGEDRFHPTFSALLSDLEERLEEKSSQKEDMELLEELRDYYLSSDIYRVAGSDLEAS